LLFTIDGIIYVIMFFVINEFMGLVSLGEAWVTASFMFINAADKVVGDANVSDARVVGHDVDIISRRVSSKCHNLKNAMGISRRSASLKARQDDLARNDRRREYRTALIAISVLLEMTGSPAD
jgi:hypothetical protein